MDIIQTWIWLRLSRSMRVTQISRGFFCFLAFCFLDKLPPMLSARSWSLAAPTNPHFNKKKEKKRTLALFHFYMPLHVPFNTSMTFSKMSCEKIRNWFQIVRNRWVKSVFMWDLVVIIIFFIFLDIVLFYNPVNVKVMCLIGQDPEQRRFLESCQPHNSWHYPFQVSPKNCQKTWGRIWKIIYKWKTKMDYGILFWKYSLM